MELNKLFQDLDELQLTDIDRHKKKLQYAEKLISSISAYRGAPMALLNAYIELSKIIEAHRVKNVNADLSLYENCLLAMRLSVCFMEETTTLFQKNEYLETMVQTQSKMIVDLQTELQEYRGIESAILNNSLKEKITAVLKKIKL